MTRLNPLLDRTVNRFSKKFDHVDCLPWPGSYRALFSGSFLDKGLPAAAQILLHRTRQVALSPSPPVGSASIY